MRIKLTRLAVGDTVWVAAGQGLSAIGTLLGIRLLTEFIAPHTYGEVVLCLGLVVLAMNIGCSPMMQVISHFYPQAQQAGEVPTLRAALNANLRRFVPLVLLVFVVIVATYVLRGGTSYLLPALLLVLLVCDATRTLHTSFFNAARQHRRYALWMIAEAWMRPLAATAAVILVPDSPEIIVASYIAVSIVLMLVFIRRRPRIAVVGRSDPALEQRMLRYARPLFALGVVDWTNGMADRYLIGALLTVADAGLYSAIYALASRPFLMLGQTLELAVRPPYQAAVSRGDTARAHQLLVHWCALASAGGMAGVALIALTRHLLAGLLLGEAFRSSANLMPFVAAGYALLAVAQVFQRVCFAHGQPQWVLYIQASAAAVGLTATAIGTTHFGLIGAAGAVPVCFLVQLGVSAYAAQRVERDAVRNRPRQDGGQMAHAVDTP